jgi:hypothetical protein
LQVGDQHSRCRVSLFQVTLGQFHNDRHQLLRYIRIYGTRITDSLIDYEAYCHDGANLARRVFPGVRAEIKDRSASQALMHRKP